MRASELLIATLKETPSDAEVISHQLMLRAGLIRKLASGLYTWLPLGVKVLRKVERIVREEMNAAGAQEVLMPVVQPAELWEESGRWQQYGAELLRISDRHEREFCLGPTHEEVITDLVRQQISSYKQLPINLYQIQTKFRDEIRPRFGVMRSREFIMKDAYSFHLNQESLQDTYDAMYAAYTKIFTRIGLDFRAVIADTGSIGGEGSHEFHVLADSGEDDIAFSNESGYAANIEMAECKTDGERAAPTQELSELATPKAKTIAELEEHHDIAPHTGVKTLIVKGDEAPFVALILRGDHQLNEIKAEKVKGVAEPLTMATDEEIRKVVGAGPGSLGPVKLNMPIIVDRAAAVMSDFTAGANSDGMHLTGINWERDASFDDIADLRNIEDGDPSPDGKGTVSIKRGIEVGHIFQLGEKYSSALGAKVLTESGKEQVVTMGCYGIGVTRVVASAIEQNHDDKGIVWPQSIAPFEVAIVGLNMHKSERVTKAAEDLYAELSALGIDVLLDDRNERPGVKFADIELIGIPHRIVIGERGLDSGKLEYRARNADENEDVPADDLVAFLRKRLAG